MPTIWDRREFLSATTLAGAGLAFTPRAQGSPALARAGDAASTAVKLEGRMTPSPATKYRPYVSKPAHTADAASWVQIDLGSAMALEGVRLYPNFNLDIRSLGFPARLRIEGSKTPGFETPAMLFDGSGRHGIDCAIEVRLRGEALSATHGRSPWDSPSTAWHQRFFNAARARASRDITVPMATWVTAAISR